MFVIETDSLLYILLIYETSKTRLYPHIIFQKTLNIYLGYKKLEYCVLISNDNAMNRFVLPVKTRENYDVGSIMEPVLAFCKYLHYFVSGHYEHSCHLYLSCAFCLDTLWYIYVNNRKLRHFQDYYLYFKSTCGLEVSSLFHDQSFIFPEICGSSPTRTAETIFLFIIHRCNYIHQISSSPV